MWLEFPCFCHHTAYEHSRAPVSSLIINAGRLGQKAEGGEVHGENIVWFSVMNCPTPRRPGAASADSSWRVIRCCVQGDVALAGSQLYWKEKPGRLSICGKFWKEGVSQVDSFALFTWFLSSSNALVKVPVWRCSLLSPVLIPVPGPDVDCVFMLVGSSQSSWRVGKRHRRHRDRAAACSSRSSGSNTFPLLAACRWRFTLNTPSYGICTLETLFRDRIDDTSNDSLVHWQSEAVDAWSKNSTSSRNMYSIPRRNTKPPRRLRMSTGMGDLRTRWFVDRRRGSVFAPIPVPVLVLVLVRVFAAADVVTERSWNSTKSPLNPYA